MTKRAVLSQGSRAPEFSLPDQEGKPRGLADFAEQYLVLFFYPKDNTPGCAIEAQSIGRAAGRFRSFKAMPIGISGGTLKTKRRFCAKLDLTVPMLTDEDFSTARAYGVYGPKKFMGITYEGISRTTFVLDAARNVIKIFEKVKPAGHAEELLDYLAKLGS
jgi:peroxiredoxin Q/BCP